jgi:hypothetical protein
MNKMKHNKKIVLDYILNGGIVGRTFIDREGRKYTILDNLNRSKLESDTQITTAINYLGEEGRKINLAYHLKDREVQKWQQN